MASSPYSNEEDSVEMEEEEEEELTSLEEEDSSDDQGGSYANVEENPRLFEGCVHSSALMDGLMMEQQPVYQDDVFGLRTLDESGRLNLTVVPGARHADWTGNEDLIRHWVLPHLN